jgi:acid stress chaperone HdeB
MHTRRGRHAHFELEQADVVQSQSNEVRAVVNLLRTFILLSVVAAPVAHAQVTVDISKITCEQFIVMPKADSIAIWLSGYYHGDKHVSTLDVNQFEENARNFRAACRLPDNFKKPIMQLIESTLPK